MKYIKADANRFNGPANVVNDAANWVECGTIMCSSAEGYTVITGTVGAGGALAALKLTRASLAEGAHIDWITDFTTASLEMPFCSPNPDTTAAGQSFQMKVSVEGAGEIAIWAKKAGADTTLAISASLHE